MKNKGRLLLALCGMLLINSTTVSAAAVTDSIVETDYVMADIYGADKTAENIVLSDKVKAVLAKKDKKEDKADKKIKIKKKNKKKKNKKNKAKSGKKKSGKKKNSLKKSKYKKNKKDKMKNKNNIDIKEEEVKKLPETDKYKPELKENEKNKQDKRENEVTPPGWGNHETLSTDYTVFCDYTDKKGDLRFQAGNSIALPEKGYVGLKANGENTGKEIEVAWSGSSFQNIKDGVKGSYTLTAVPKENIIIGGKDYGMVKFIVNIIVE